jgi:hypothetical protein
MFAALSVPEPVHHPAPPPPALAMRAITAAPTHPAHIRTVVTAPDVKATLHPAAIAKRARITAAPNVKATIPPDPVAKSGTPIVPPNVKATLSPAEATTSIALIVRPDINATLPPEPIIPRGAEPLLPPDTGTEAGTESLEIPPPNPEQAPAAMPTTIRLRGTRLCARRLGQSVPPLDERIKNSRSRKIRIRLKTRRKHASRLKPDRKHPARRIVAAPNVYNTFVSAKAATKIVGAPPKPLRVRLPASP